MSKVLSLLVAAGDPVDVEGGALRVEPFSLALTVVLVLSVIALLLFTAREIKRDGYGRRPDDPHYDTRHHNSGNRRW